MKTGGGELWARQGSGVEAFDGDNELAGDDFVVFGDYDMIVFFGGNAGKITRDEGGAGAKHGDLDGGEEVDGGLEVLSGALEFEDWGGGGGGGLVVVVFGFPRTKRFVAFDAIEDEFVRSSEFVEAGGEFITANVVRVYFEKESGRGHGKLLKNVVEYENFFGAEPGAVKVL